MAEINVNELQTRRNGAADDHPDLTKPGDYSPALKILAKDWIIKDPRDVIGQYDPLNITDEQMKLMANDPMLAFAGHYIMVPVINAKWHMDCKDLRVQAFATEAYKEIHISLMLEMMQSMWYGRKPIVTRFTRRVPDWTYEDEQGDEKDVWPEKDIPAVLWNTPRGLDPQGAEIVFKKNGQEYDGFQHSKYVKKDGDTKQLRVPRSHSLWVTHDLQAAFNNMYGLPRTRFALRYWWSFWFRFTMQDEHFEKDADPPLMVGVPEEMVPDPDDPTKTIPAQELGVFIGENLRRGGTIVKPSTTYESEVDGRITGIPKWTAEFLRGGENLAVFENSLETLDKRKLQAMLLPPRALIEPKTGGATLGDSAETYQGFFTESLALWSQELDRYVNDYMIPDLIAQNFVNPPTCKKVTTGFLDDDMKLVTDLVMQLASVDPASLDLDVREMVRQVGLPQIKPQEDAQVSDDAGSGGGNGGGGEGNSGNPSAGGDLNAEDVGLLKRFVKLFRSEESGEEQHA